MGRKKIPREKRLEVPFTLRLSTKDVARIEDLAERLPLTVSGLAREALRRGLALIEENPAVLLKPVPTPKSKKSRSKK